MLKYARYDKSVVIIDILSKKNKFDLYDLNDEELVQEILKILSMAQTAKKRKIKILLLKKKPLEKLFEKFPSN